MGKLPRKLRIRLAPILDRRRVHRSPYGYVLVDNVGPKLWIEKLALAKDTAVHNGAGALMVKFASYRNEPFGSSRVSTWYLYTPTGDLVCTSAPKDVGYKPYPHKAVWTVTYFTRLRQTNA